MQRDEPTRGEEPLSKSCSLSPANVQRQQQDREETQLLRNSSRGLLTYPAIMGFFAGNCLISPCWVCDVGTN